MRRDTWTRCAVFSSLSLSLVCAGCDAPVEALESASDGLLGDEAEVSDPDEREREDDGGPPMDPLSLVEAEAWEHEAGRDPLAIERPANVDCPAAAWGPELGGLEIQTGTCNYFFATQPSLAAIEPGDAVEVVVFHDRLDAAEPAEGHVAILMEDEVIWEAHVEIPASANVLEASVIADRAWPAGTTVGLHLHNHGYNAWTMLELTVVPHR